VPGELRVLTIALVLAAHRSGPSVATACVHAGMQPPATRVRFIDPPAATLPANRLQMVVVFSAAMAAAPGQPHLSVLDPIGHDVHDAIRPAERPWNEPRTRYTFALDPTRVRPGGGSDEAVSYTLLVDQDWRDACGLPLAVPFLRRFRVGPPAAPATARGPDPACAPSRERAALPPSAGVGTPHGVVSPAAFNLTPVRLPFVTGPSETSLPCS
jgi:hypothetical protein